MKISKFVCINRKAKYMRTHWPDEYSMYTYIYGELQGKVVKTITPTHVTGPYP